MVHTQDDQSDTELTPANQKDHKGSLFTRAEEECLINLWVQDPILWDSHHPDYKTHTIKDAAKEKIANAMGRTVNDVRIKMKYLNDQFTRARRKLFTNPESANLSKRDRYLLRRLDFVREGKGAPPPPQSFSQSNINQDNYDDDDDDDEEEDDAESVESDGSSVQEYKDPIQITNISAITATIDPSNAGGDDTTVSFSTTMAEEGESDRKDFVFHNSVTPPTTVTLPTGTFVPRINVVSQQSSPSTSKAGGSVGRRRSPRIMPQTLLITNRPQNAQTQNTVTRSGKKRKASAATTTAEVTASGPKGFSVSLEKKTEADYFGYFVTEALKSMAPDTRSWCQMEMSKIIHSVRSGDWKKAAAATAAASSSSASRGDSAEASGSGISTPVASTSSSGQY